MSLVAHRFGRVEYRIFVVVFFRQAHLKKSKPMFDILNSTLPNQWATNDIKHKNYMPYFFFSYQLRYCICGKFQYSNQAQFPKQKNVGAAKLPSKLNCGALITTLPAIPQSARRGDRSWTKRVCHKNSTSSYVSK